jgi:hypothetical protein
MAHHSVVLHDSCMENIGRLEENAQSEVGKIIELEEDAFFDLSPKPGLSIQAIKVEREHLNA